MTETPDPRVAALVANDDDGGRQPERREDWVEHLVAIDDLFASEPESDALSTWPKETADLAFRVGQRLVELGHSTAIIREEQSGKSRHNRLVNKLRSGESLTEGDLKPL